MCDLQSFSPGYPIVLQGEEREGGREGEDRRREEGGTGKIEGGRKERESPPLLVLITEVALFQGVDHRRVTHVPI